MRDRAEDQMMLALIRHGETRANIQRRYLGKTDESLSERGIERLLSYREKNRYPEVDCLFSSPMKRCMETAGILYPMLEPVIIPEWEEMDFGRFEYKNWKELKDDADYQAWIDGGGAGAFPGGESREAFIERCMRGFCRMCGILRAMEEERKPFQESVGEEAGRLFREPTGEEARYIRAGLIVHGGTIMALLSSYGEREYFDCQCANGGGYLCRLEGWREYALRQGGEKADLKAGIRIREEREI